MVKRGLGLRRLALSMFILVMAFLFIPYMVIPVHAAEPSLTTVFNHLGFTNVAISNVETFPAGLYEITLYAEFAGYHESNQLSYYKVGTNTYNLIFDGPEGGFGYLSPPITKTITVDSQFGFSMYTPEHHRYFTENGHNPDGKIHAKVYENLNDPGMFLIGFENLYGTGDRDYQDFVFSVKLRTPQNVIPEVPFGTILGFLSMFMAFLGFVGFKRLRHR